MVAEQRGICCYCMSRIVADLTGMKIEHWHCQTRFPERQLDYSNLLGACSGGEGKPSKEQHCDTRKGDRDLSKNPAVAAHDVERTIRYGSNGIIRSTDDGFDREINDVLNLNTPLLRNNRYEALTGFIQSRPKNGSWNESQLRRWLEQSSRQSGAGDLEPFCQIVIYWLRKRLGRA